MSCKKLAVEDSKIQGIGLFAAEPIKMGDVVMLWNMDAFLIGEAEYNSRQANGDKLIEMTGVRYVADYFLYTDANPRYENYINHSFSPNILYHCGVCFALRDINSGDELTADYTYLLSETDDMDFVDAATGRKVTGLSGLECLLQTTEILREVLLNVQNRGCKEDNINKKTYLSQPYIPKEICNGLKIPC
jgi:SET domain-containing protein